MNHKEKALDLLTNQYHCSQALFGAFASDFDIDIKTAFKISTCFGGGMRCGDLCGCISASLMVLGLKYGFYDSQDKEIEMFGNKKTEEFIKKFKEKMNGKTVCREILGNDISKPDELAIIRENGLILKNCPKAINASIDILEDMIYDNNFNVTYNKQEIDSIIDKAEIDVILKKVDKLNKFRKNVINLISNSENKIAFIQFDIRRFKIINDLYGEKMGDEILYFIKEMLSNICNDKQYYLNLRSDVFMVVTEYNEESELIKFVKKLEKSFSIFKDIKIQVTFGVYTVEDKNMEFRQMEDRAAMARKTAKKNLLANISFYKEQFKELLYARKFIEENMELAILEEQFKMYLQPKYSILHNKIVGAEALVRWVHPTKGMVCPDDFIPILEENGFIKKVDYYIWEKVCKFLKRCSTQNILDCPISVNVSRLHLKDKSFMGILDKLIYENNIKKSLLELEITETLNDQHISQKAMELKKEGFTLLMDDFGSGYSSLNILLETPFDVIKIDKQFMKNMLVSEKGKLIMEYVISMAKKLGLELIAEGVETKEQIDLLRNIGCDTVQGYYYAKPMSEDEFYKLLLEDRNKLH